MSNPLNEQIAKLLKDIMDLERERDKHYDELGEPSPKEAGSIQAITEELMDTKRHELSIESLSQQIDEKRQELISTELIMLDKSIEDLRSTTAQVDSSVKALQVTGEQTLRSSVGLERSTKILIFATLLLAVIAVFNISFDLFRADPLLGGLGILGSFIVIIAGFLRTLPILREKP